MASGFAGARSLKAQEGLEDIANDDIRGIFQDEISKWLEAHRQ